jgi:hypothetical protein
MNCKTLHTKIIFFNEGSLPAWEMEEIKIHLENCSDCVAFANELKKTLAVIENEKMPQLNPFFYTRVKARLKTRPKMWFQPGKRQSWCVSCNLLYSRCCCWSEFIQALKSDNR